MHLLLRPRLPAHKLPSIQNQLPAVVATLAAAVEEVMQEAVVVAMPGVVAEVITKSNSRKALNL